MIGNGVLAQAHDANIVFCQLAPYSVSRAQVAVPSLDASGMQQHNLRRTYRRTSFLVTRLLANMGVSGKTPLLSRFSAPVGEAARESVLANGDFRLDTDNAVADHWQFSSNSKQAACVLEGVAPGAAQRCLRITLPRSDEDESGSVMLAQHGVPVQKGQWYRISLKAKAEGPKGPRVTLTLTNTADWRSFFKYQRFAPDKQWKPFTFLVQSNDTADTKPRFQIWHGEAGTVWLSDLRMVPCDPPTQGRWLTGLYLDAPVEMDDPYRFFRW